MVLGLDAQGDGFRTEDNCVMNKAEEIECLDQVRDGSDWILV